MNENLEVLEYLHEDIDMAKITLKTLEKSLQEKCNKIKGFIADKQEKYDILMRKVKKLIKDHGGENKKKSTGEKAMARLSIRREVKKDNSDSHISDMLIKGFTMSSLEIHKRLDNHEERIDEKVLDIARDVLNYVEISIEELKAYL